MGLKGVASRDVGQGPSRVTFTFSDPGPIVTYQKQPTDTESDVHQALLDAADFVGRTADMPVFFVHINRNATVAIATGAEPDVWPEDDVD